VKPAERFLIDLASRWTHPSRPLVRIIGSTALMLRTDFDRMTKDSDILDTPELDDETKQRLRDLGGKDTDLAKQRNMYVDFVPNGLPLLPHAPRWHRVILPGAAATIAFDALDIVDVCVSKLRRFHGDDRLDIRAMIDRDLVAHESFVERFKNAIDDAQYTMGGAAVARCVEHFHDVERDVYGVEETEIEWTDWD
jgi:hypothetical protein